MRIVAFNLALLHLLPVIAQDFLLDPYNDPIELDAGFDDDPHMLEVTPGGSSDAGDLSNNCVGFVSEKPVFAVYYTSGEYDLNFAVASMNEMDTTLIINDPSGNWVCNDDFEGVNPAISFDDPENGRYDIWVGTYDLNETSENVVLLVTEIDLGEVYERVADVLTESSDEGSSSGGYGTGFVVSERGHILTNHHVVEGCSEITFQIRGSETREVALLSTNVPSDLALLKIDSFDGDPAGFLSSSIARMGEELVVYGFPLAGDLSAQGNFTNGIVSAMSGLHDDLTKFQMTAPIQPGNSGGPVLSLSGQIIGVVVETANQEFFREQRDTDTQNINFAIHGAIVMRFLETNNVRYEVESTKRDILSLAELASRTQEFTGIVRCINNEISDIDYRDAESNDLNSEDLVLAAFLENGMFLNSHVILDLPNDSWNFDEGSFTSEDGAGIVTFSNANLPGGGIRIVNEPDLDIGYENIEAVITLNSQGEDVEDYDLEYMDSILVDGNRFWIGIAEAKVQNIDFRFYYAVYTGDAGTLQIIGYSFPAQFDGLISEIEKLLASPL